MSVLLLYRQQTLARGHLDVATTYNSLACVLGDQGDLEKA